MSVPGDETTFLHESSKVQPLTRCARRLKSTALCTSTAAAKNYRSLQALDSLIAHFIMPQRPPPTPPLPVRRTFPSIFNMNVPLTPNIRYWKFCTKD